jgi:adenine phosphoribosyltransferase
MGLVDDLRRTIRDVPDFPKKGILFRDITPVLKSPALFEDVIGEFARRYRPRNVEGIAAVESRGFIFGAPLAVSLGVPFLLIRKKGKLPCRTCFAEYELEYGTDRIEMHEDAISRGQRILVMDDLLATGGTAVAAARLVESMGGTVVACVFVVELKFLNGRDKLKKYEVVSLVAYES